jgi:hypothetical protein
MSKSNAWEQGLLLLLFNNTTFANVGDVTGLPGAATVGNFYLSLHTADPGEAGDQTTSEVTYTSYARKSVARTTGGFTVSAGAVTLVANQDFVTGTGGSGTATHFGLGTASSGAGVLLYSGTLTPNIVCGNGVTPRINSGVIITED